MTSWVLVFWMSVAQGYSPATIPNLKSYEECARVSEIVKQTVYRFSGSKCIEVINK